ncbi:MAG: GrpB family protein [Burkholderiaceae bacterium]
MTIARNQLDRIEIVPSDPTWPVTFATEAARIRAALPAEYEHLTIEHIGSTAVPGLAAKPVIDLLLIASDTSRWPRLAVPLQELGYVRWDDNPRPDRVFFVKGLPPFGIGRTHHVHVRTPADAVDEIVFRDWLRAHAGDAARYAALKRELAARHVDDRQSYTEGKTAFVAEVLARARREPR